MMKQIPRIVGIGEVGLDYSGSFFSQDDQFRIPKFMVRRAVEMDLPLVLHVRGPKHGNPLEASLDCINILKDQRLPTNYRIYKRCTTSKLEHPPYAQYIHVFGTGRGPPTTLKFWVRYMKSYYNQCDTNCTRHATGSPKAKLRVAPPFTCCQRRQRLSAPVHHRRAV